jgi:hypothetical protein
MGISALGQSSLCQSSPWPIQHMPRTDLELSRPAHVQRLPRPEQPMKVPVHDEWNSWRN